MKSPYRRTAIAALAAICVAVVGLAVMSTPTFAACPFCSPGGQTLTTEATQASMVLFGRLTNAKPDFNNVDAGTTDLVIEKVVKADGILAGRNVITLPRYIPPDKDSKFLIFCDVYNGKVDPYKGEAVPPDSRIADYLKGALEIKDKDPVARLQYFFKYLDDKDIVVSNDAYTEFGVADYKDFRKVAEKASPQKVVAWLKDPQTPPSRLGLYGSVLGHCGKAADAKLLRDLIDDPQHQLTSGIDGVLAGLVQLQPKEGWDYLTGILNSPQKDFLLRYAALRAARFFHDFRPDVIPSAQVTPAVVSLLEQKDIADLAIEDLRKWSSWSETDRIIGLYGRESHNVPIIRRAIVRFALSCPPDKSPKAAAFVAARKKEDPKWVEEVEELLRLENAPPAVPTGGGK